MSKKKKITDPAAEVPPKETSSDEVSRFEKEMDDILAELASMENFSYDPASDPAYGQYKDTLQKQGRLAMRDTMGQASALTGGYGSSYAATAGQAAYDASLARLQQLLPTLQENAYNRHRDSRADLLTRYDLIKDAKEDAYKRKRDSLADLRYESETAYKQEQWEKEFAEDKRRFDHTNGIATEVSYEGFTDDDFGRYFMGIALLEGKDAAQALAEELARLNIIHGGNLDYYRQLVDSVY